MNGDSINKTDLLFDYIRCICETNNTEECEFLLSLAPSSDTSVCTISDVDRKVVLAICLACCECANGSQVQSQLLDYLTSFVKSLHRMSFTHLNTLYPGCKSYHLPTVENFVYCINDTLCSLADKCAKDVVEQIGLCQMGLVQRLISDITGLALLDEGDKVFSCSFPMLLGTLRAIGRSPEVPVMSLLLAESDEPEETACKLPPLSFQKVVRPQSDLPTVESDSCFTSLSEVGSVHSICSVSEGAPTLPAADHFMNTIGSSAKCESPWNQTAWPTATMRPLLVKLLDRDVLYVLDKLWAAHRKYFKHVVYRLPSHALLLVGMKLCKEILWRSSQENATYGFGEMLPILDHWQRIGYLALRESHESRSLWYEAEAVSLQLGGYLIVSDNDAESLFTKSLECLNQASVADANEPPQIKVPLIEAVIEVLTKLSSKRPFLTPTVVRLLRDFLIEPSELLVKMFNAVEAYDGIHIEDNPNFFSHWYCRNVYSKRPAYHAFDAVRNSAIEGLCSSIRSCEIARGYEILKSLVLTLFARLTSLSLDGRISYLIAHNVVVTLSTVAVRFYDVKDTYGTIISSFQQFLNDPRNVDITLMIIDQLGMILVNSPDFAHNEILTSLSTLVMNGYESVASSQIKTSESSANKARRSLSSAISVFTNIASQVQGEERLHELLVRLLVLFMNLALIAKENAGFGVKRGSNATKYVGILGILIPVIGSVLKRVSPIVNVQPRLQKLFRDFWLYISLFGLSDPLSGVWPNEWVQNVSVLAVLSPPIVNKSHLRNLEYNFPFSVKQITKVEVQELKAKVIGELNCPESKYLLDKLSYVQTAYLYAICTLESLRAKNSVNEGAFSSIFKYLEEPAIQRDKSDMWKCIRLVASKCFKLNMDLLKSQPLSKQRDRHLVNLVFFLVEKVCSLFSPLSNEALLILHNLLSAQRFPHLIWDYQVVQVLLDLVEVLHRSLSEDYNKVSNAVKLRETNIEVMFHDDHHRRRRLYDDVSKLCRIVIQKSFEHVPLLTKSNVQHYVFKAELWGVELGFHPGLKIACEVLSAGSTNQPQKSDQYLFMSPLNQRSFCVGYIKGMEKVGADKTSEILVDELESLSSGFCYEANSYKQKSDRRASTHRSGLVAQTLCKISALIIMQPAFNGSTYLIHLIAWAPAVIFTEEAMNAALDCWNWIFSAKRELRAQLMREIISAWEFTVTQEKGLYSKRPNYPDPFSLDSNEKTKMVLPNVKPHRIWLNFMEEQLSVAMHNDCEVVSMFCSMFYNCLSYNDDSIKMNNHVSAVGPYFRLLAMALRLVMESRPKCDLLNADVLIERVVHCAFDYFAGPSARPTQSAVELKEDVESLAKFFQYVHKEKRPIKTRTATSSSSVKQEEVVFRPNFRGNQLSVSPVGPQRDARSHELNSDVPLRARLSVESDAISNISSYTAKHSAMATLTLNRATTPSGDKRKHLLLSLVAIEMRRLKVYLGVLSRPAITFQSEVYSIVENWHTSELLNATPALLQEMAKVAWTESPDVACYLNSRLRKEAVEEELSRLIAEDPARIRHRAPALRIVMSHEQQAKLLAEDPIILLWDRLNPVDALSYFFENTAVHKCPLTVQFACSCLIKCSPTTLVMYIPQLVQALRRNQYSYPSYLVLSLAKRSDILAHQFIWNMEANRWFGNMIEQDPMWPKLDAMVRLIKENFDKNSREFYRREFSFVEDVVSISEKIKKFPKGPSRQLACSREFQRVELRADCYLPSNPENLITGINYQSAVPMQSAAKAPYRASFFVQHVGIEAIEHAVRTGEDISVEAHLEAEQMAIFKVGDDVRQDILAVQLIRIFKCIFEMEDLDLSLYPYNVIAVGPGRGVIECIPNAMSRDEIGRKVDGDMFRYFCNKYGDRDTVTFQRARQNFVKSMAAYSLVLFLLQVKDRHNGNIMIDANGNIIHIDFGFMFETSPGGNLGFEPDIKLTDEMIMIMGGSVDSSSFEWFKALCIKGYLSLRGYRPQICELVTMMLGTRLPCFLGRTIEQLNMRFQPDMDDGQASEYLTTIISNCTRAVRTHLYDMFQYHQNQIPY